MTQYSRHHHVATCMVHESYARLFERWMPCECCSVIERQPQQGVVATGRFAINAGTPRLFCRFVKALGVDISPPSAIHYGWTLERCTTDRAKSRFVEELRLVS